MVTALIRVKICLIMSIVQIKSVLLVLMDLSAAFDTLGHNEFFSRLKDMFGVSSKILE